MAVTAFEVVAREKILTVISQVSMSSVTQTDRDASYVINALLLS